MIVGFADRDTERLFHRQRVPRFAEVERVALRKLAMLDAAREVKDLTAPPGNRLEALRGNRAGQWSIRVNDRWRICFVWRDGNAEAVELTDYH